VLTVAGLDPGGGAGAIADLRTFHTHRCWPTAVLSAQTVQTVREVRRWVAVDEELFADQLAAVADDHRIAAIKIGMLPTSGLVERLGAFIADRAAGVPVVMDPVLRATTGSELSSPESVAASIRRLLPLVTVLTPNRGEAERLCDLPSGLAAAELGRQLLTLGAGAVVVTGGHDRGGEVETLLITDHAVEKVHARSIQSDRTHGTGCLFSSALAARLAHGESLLRSVEAAHRWVSRCVERGQPFASAGAPDPATESTEGGWSDS
jgi:hydroxymethylpyrimidine/phosphomethylpyrimidine kinase